MALNTASQGTNRCGRLCLGPLTFHTQVLGDQVSLSKCGRIARRTENTFKNGLVFSSRPVEVNERLRLRVQTQCEGWNGALRIGFTTVSPTARTGPLPSMAIPDLTDTFGHWACAISDNCCYPGTELEFWVSAGGRIYVNVQDRKYKCIEGVDISRPLWAMIDVYGKTQSILLLGSKKRTMFSMQKSCPEHLGEQLYFPDINEHYKLTHHVTDSDCAVCMAQEASITLQCGHRCLCPQCAFRVKRDFGTCPLCRRDI